MASGGFFRGTSVDQDSRFFNQNKKLLAKLSFPASFDQKVDLTKVKSEVIGQWITERVTQLLGFEDDIVVAMIINLLEPKVDERLDPRQMQLTITGFLEKDAPAFMEELWNLLLSAQAHPTGIPPAILEKKKQEMAHAAQEKRQLREVLDRKRQDAGTQPSSAYGLSVPSEKRTRENNSHHGRERDRSPHRGGRRPDRRRRNASPVRSRRRRQSRSRSPLHSRSRSRSRGRRGSRRSRSRSDSRHRSRRGRGRRSPSSSRERRPRQSRRRSVSSQSRSPSEDQFGRRRRRTLSKSPSRSRSNDQRKSRRSRSVSD